MLEHFQLDAIEPLLCCAFRSKHRHIVNNAVLLWNRSFDSTSEVDYPATLKDVLLSLRSYVDLTLPGLDDSTCATNDFAPMFLDSQDDFDVITLSKVEKANSTLNDSASSGNLETPKAKQISQSITNKSENILSRSGSKSARSTRSTRSTRSSTRNRTPKPRHEDSQIQFAPIEESSPSNRPVEPQILTDRQKEVRERQLENATLFPTIRSSPEKSEKVSAHISYEASPRRSDRIQSPAVDRSATPRATHSYEYLSSTPTPRRGQQIMIEEDHEMTDDIPSSPPEPRRNLLPEMKSHSRDTRMPADIPISSSPISGSPVSKKALPFQSEQPEPESYIASVAAEPISSKHALSVVHDHAMTMPNDLATDHEHTMTENGAIDQTRIRASEVPATPNTENLQRILSSDDEMFVDASTSPIATKRAASGNATESVDLSEEDEYADKDRSFAMSDEAERSMARLVIELDSRKCEPLPFYDAASPEKIHITKDIIECITVQSEFDEVQPNPGGSQNAQTTPPETVTLDTSDDSQSSQKRVRKRKRASDRKQHNSGKKRRHLQADDDDTDMILDSQIPLASNQELTESDPSEAAEYIEDIGPIGYSQASPDLSYNPGNDESMEPLDLDEDGTDSDTVAVNLQLITEASQQSETDGHLHGNNNDAPGSPELSGIGAVGQHDEEMDDKVSDSEPPKEEIETPAQVELSAVEKIAASLRDGLQVLQTATLSRRDVYKIEDMFMDIKKELYEAERRSRHNTD